MKIFQWRRWLPTWAWIILVMVTGFAVFLGIWGWQALLSSSHDDVSSEDTNHRQTIAPPPPALITGQLPTYTFTPTITITPSPSTTPPPISSPMSMLSPLTALPTFTLAPTVVAQNGCVPPTDWKPYTIQQGDTLFAFQLGASRAGNPATVDEIIAANCLTSSFILEGQVLWLPDGAADEAPSSSAPVTQLPQGVPRVAQCAGCSITIQAGWRLEQIAEVIDRTPVAFSGADFLALTRAGAPIPPRDFLSSVPAGGSLEGFMFPGSYALGNETTAEQFRDMVLDAFGANVGNIAAPSLTTYQTIILASIIQRESGNTNEQHLISSVFHNRLGAGKGLGATVTLQYAIGRSGDWWPRPYAGITDLNTPYNTNIYQGLPPTAISNPSLSALQAAANPAQTNYFYFTGNCMGTGNLYAATYEEHLANVQSCN